MVVGYPLCDRFDTVAECRVLLCERLDLGL